MLARLVVFAFPVLFFRVLAQSHLPNQVIEPPRAADFLSNILELLLAHVKFALEELESIRPAILPFALVQMQVPGVLTLVGYI